MNIPRTSTAMTQKQMIPLAGWLILSLTASVTAVFVSTDGWYADLSKPTWNPPAWVFGPVWTLLYVAMGFAAWLVWRVGGWKTQGLPLGIFLLQWVFNALWTPLFFGMHRIEIAFVDIVMLWIAILATTLLFWRVSRGASMLLVPYLAWVSFAATLNFAIWQLNPRVAFVEGL
jgi:tryptophan-rich sensory protein